MGGTSEYGRQNQNEGPEGSVSTRVPTTAQLEKIEARIRRATQNDPMDQLLDEYRRLTVEDILRIDVHWYRGWYEGRTNQRPGRIEPLFQTNRMKVSPLRMLRGFLYRLDRGIAKPQTDQQVWRHVKRPGHGVVYNLNETDGLVDGTGCFGDLPWKLQARRMHRGGLKCAVQDQICRTWGWSMGNCSFWDGPSGPYLWERPDGRFIAADHDAGGDPTLIDLVWRPNDASQRPREQ